MTKNNKIKKYLGITAWNKAGYTGKGIKIMSFERVSSESDFKYVTALDGYGDDNNGHGDRVMQQMYDIAPDAEYYTCTTQGSCGSSWKPAYLDYVLNLNIPLCTASKLSYVYTLSLNKENDMQECIDNGTTFFIGAGNGGGELDNQMNIASGANNWTLFSTSKYTTIADLRLI